MNPPGRYFLRSSTSSSLEHQDWDGEKKVVVVIEEIELFHGENSALMRELAGSREENTLFKTTWFLIIMDVEHHLSD